MAVRGKTRNLPDSSRGKGGLGEVQYETVREGGGTTNKKDRRKEEQISGLSAVGLLKKGGVYD